MKIRSKHFIYVNEFYVDGVLLKTFIGKKVPKELQRLLKLKGCRLIVSMFREGSYEKWEGV